MTPRFTHLYYPYINDILRTTTYTYKTPCIIFPSSIFFFFNPPPFFSLCFVFVYNFATEFSVFVNMSGSSMRSDFDEEKPHVLAVDDSLVDRKIIEKLLTNSSCKGNYIHNNIVALLFSCQSFSVSLKTTFFLSLFFAHNATNSFLENIQKLRKAFYEFYAILFFLLFL